MALRADFTQSDLERFFDENQVDEVECLVPDLTGVARGKILPRTKFTQDRGMRLAESVLAMTVTGEAPDSQEYDAIISPNDYDMELLADPTTVCVVPWVPAPSRTAQIIHDCYFADGRLVDFAPRSVLRRVRELYAQDGLAPVVAPVTSAVAPVVAVQNTFHVHHHAGDAALLAQCAEAGIAFVPFFPLGGGNDPIDPARLEKVASRHHATVPQVALAWLLAGSPSMLPIPGTGNLAHLEENVAAAALRLTPEDLATLAG